MEIFISDEPIFKLSYNCIKTFTCNIECSNDLVCITDPVYNRNYAYVKSVFIDDREYYVLNYISSTIEVTIVDKEKLYEYFEKRNAMSGRMVCNSQVYLCEEYYTIDYEAIWKPLTEKITSHCNHLYNTDWTIINEGKFLDLYIKFDKIIMTNRDRYPRIIRDLIVRIDFALRKKSIIVNNIAGARTTFTKREVNSEEWEDDDGDWRVGDRQFFPHPHLPSGEGDYQYFCLGDSALGATYLSMKNEITDFNLECLLYMLPEYLSYESLEGGPYYTSLETVSNYMQTGSNFNYSEARATLLNNKAFVDMLTDYLKIVPTVSKSGHRLSVPGIELGSSWNEGAIIREMMRAAIKKHHTGTSTSLFSERTGRYYVKRPIDDFDADDYGSVRYGNMDISISIIDVPDEDIEMEEKWFNFKEVGDNTEQILEELVDNFELYFIDRIRPEITELIQINYDEYIEEIGYTRSN